MYMLTAYTCIHLCIVMSWKSACLQAKMPSHTKVESLPYIHDTYMHAYIYIYIDIRIPIQTVINKENHDVDEDERFACMHTYIHTHACMHT